MLGVREDLAFSAHNFCNIMNIEWIMEGLAMTLNQETVGRYTTALGIIPFSIVQEVQELA